MRGKACSFLSSSMHQFLHQFHAAGSNVTEVHDKLIASAELASRWYRSNFLKGNYDKYQTMTLGNKNNDMDSIIIDDNEVKSTKCLKLLGVYIDNRLQFDEHIANICKRSSQRVGVLMRLRNMIPTDTKLKLFKAAILPYLTYSHLVWHFCRASDTRKLERIQERALRAVYCDKGSSYDKLLDMANLSTLQCLSQGMYHHSVTSDEIELVEKKHLVDDHTIP